MFWKTKRTTWLVKGERCAVILEGKVAEGHLAQVNGDISCVDLDNGKRYLTPNEEILVRRDDEYAVGIG